MASQNPFSPTFGASPLVLAGRDDILGDIDDALTVGPTHPDYTALFIGVRGAGKTAMLNAVEDLARQRGWLTVSDTAAPAGLLDRLADAAARLLSQNEPPPPARRVKAAAVAGVGSIEFHQMPEAEPSRDLRSLLADLGDRLADNGTGLMITLDELQSGVLDEIREFGAVVQHVTRREERPVAFAGAALPQIEDTMLSDDAATFLQRCSRHDIGRLDPLATKAAIAGPIEERGTAIDPQALEEAVAATSGYAFMIQLVGFHAWKAAGDPMSGITAEEVAIGIAEAERRISRLVLAPMWRGLSDVDQRFLVAMARDDEASELAAVAARLGVEINYAGVYRRRLLKAGMIVPVGKGRVDFAHHAARAWLRAEPAYAAATFPDD